MRVHEIDKLENTSYRIYTNEPRNEANEGAIQQFINCMKHPNIVQGFLAPDFHQGYTFPIGTVVKVKDRIFPGGIGYDIGCGVACLELNINYKDVDLEALKTYILKTIPVGFHKHSEPQDTSALDFTGTSVKLQDIFSQKGKHQLGTLGGGNHFIEVGYLESNENIAIVIHSGSRGFGHGVASHYMQEAAFASSANTLNPLLFKWGRDFAKRNKGFKFNNLEGYRKAFKKFIATQKAQHMKKQDIEGLHSFDINSPLGKQYLADQNFCLDYALLNRRAMIQDIYLGILDQVAESQTLAIPKKIQFINRNHNHAELKDGYIIHRKGATHAEKDMLGVIPGNMRDGSFIVKGKGNPDSLQSSSHGAGRVLSRKKAKATLDLAEFQAETAKLVTNHTDEMLDEAPGAYKDIFEVMRLQSDLVEVIDRVIPVLNIKG